MMKFTVAIALLVLAVAVLSVPGEAHRHRASSMRSFSVFASGPSFNVSAPQKLKNGKKHNTTVTCEFNRVECQQRVYLSVKVPSETFRGSERDVKFTLRNDDVECVNTIGSACDPATRTEGDGRIRMLVSKGVTVPPKVNISADISDSKETKTKSLDDETTYLITLIPPQADFGADVTRWSAIVEAEWDEGTPTWVVIVLSVGSVLALAVLIALGYCIWARCFKKRGNYERFD